MESSTELWLMANGRGISLVSAHAVTPISDSVVSPPEDATHLESAAPQLADVLRDRVRRPGLTLVNLHLGLPEAWQRMPWESLTLDGRKLFGKVLFCRHAKPEAPPSTTTGRLLHVHSLWPDASLVAGILKRVIREGEVRLRPAALDWPLPSQTWRNTWALAVVGHGSDDPALPAQDEHGAPWRFPLLGRWPQVVFLLACGVDSSLVRQARTLLDAGARTVVVGEGILDLRASLEGLARLVAGFGVGGDLPAAMAALQQEDKRPGGVRQWVVCGRPPRATTHSRLDQWTLESLVEKGDLSLAPERWRDFHQTEHGAHGEGDLLNELKNTPCWPITATWALPQALELAEVYDAQAQAALSTRFAALSKALHTHRPHQSDHALARYLRRRGMTLAALRALMLAMEEVPPEVMELEDRLRYLLTLFDLLLDLHLPETAGAVREHIRSQFVRVEGLELTVLKHHWLDRDCTWHWRGGRLAVAYTLQLTKRDQALDMGEDGYRELARLLWMASWLKHADVHALLAEAESVMGAEQLATLDKSGNDDFKYLMRSCALARWRFGLPEKTPDGVRYLLHNTLSEASLDPSPSATTIIINAMHTNVADERLALALLRLEEAGYWLETGHWACLHGQQARVAHALERLALARNQAESMLRDHATTLIAWLGEADTWLDAMRRECDERSTREREALVPGAKPWEHGLIL